MDNDKDNLINPDTDVWLGFLAIFMNYTVDDDSWKKIEDCVIRYEGNTPIFDDQKVKQLLESKGKEFRPYFEEMKKVVNNTKKESNYVQRSNRIS